VSLKEIDQAIKLAPAGNVRAAYYATKAGFLNRAGEHEQAILACKQSIELVDRNLYAFVELGLASLERGLFQEAATALEKAVRIRSDYNIYTILAKALMTVDPGKALESAERALELKPDWADAIAMRDQALKRLRQS
jgi:tetratricopeptide (TPR) repeat protein